MVTIYIMARVSNIFRFRVGTIVSMRITIIGMVIF